MSRQRYMTLALLFPFFLSLLSPTLPLACRVVNFKFYFLVWLLPLWWQA